MEPDEVFAGDAIASAVFVGPAGPHVPATDSGGEVEQVLWILADGHQSAGDDERIRRRAIVYRD